MTNIALGERYEHELDLLIAVKLFPTRSEALRAAIRALYDSLSKETRIQLALQAYKQGATLSRAAELGRLSYGELRKAMEDPRERTGDRSLATDASRAR